VGQAAIGLGCPKSATVKLGSVKGEISGRRKLSKKLDSGAHVQRENTDFEGRGRNQGSALPARKGKKKKRRKSLY